MSPYTSLSRFLIIFALFGNIVAEENDTAGNGSSSKANGVGQKVARGLSSYWKNLVFQSRVSNSCPYQRLHTEGIFTQKLSKTNPLKLTV